MKEVFQRLYETYHHELFQFLFYMVKNREQAEDLVQEVYIKVLKSYNQFEGRSSEKTWLFSIGRHVAIDWFRKQKRRNENQANNITEEVFENLVFDDAPLPDEMVIQNEEIKALYTCMKKCTVDQRTVLILRYIQSFSIKETASILDWSESKVKTTQHRGVKVLQSLMNEMMSEGGNQDEKVRLQ